MQTKKVRWDNAQKRHSVDKNPKTTECPKISLSIGILHKEYYKQLCGKHTHEHCKRINGSITHRRKVA